MSSPEPTLTESLRRASPRDLNRVLAGYLAVAIAALCGLPVLVIGWFAATQCTSEGFRCLGWFIYGMLGAGVLAAVALPIIGWRLRLGWWFGFLAIALVVAPLVLGDGSVSSGTAFLGPGLAAWVSEPRLVDPLTANPLAPPPRPASGPRHWAPRFLAVLVLAILVPLLGRVI